MNSKLAEDLSEIDLDLERPNDNDALLAEADDNVVDVDAAAKFLTDFLQSGNADTTKWRLMSHVYASKASDYFRILRTHNLSMRLCEA